MSDGEGFEFWGRIKDWATTSVGRAFYWAIQKGWINWMLVGPETPHFRIGVVFVGSVLVIAVVVYRLVVLIDFGTAKTLLDAYPYLARSVAVIIVLAAGVVLYWVKQKARLAYGMVETGCAVAAGWQAVGGLNHGTFPEFFAFIASIYFAVRGAENSYIGFGELREYVEEMTKGRVLELFKLPRPAAPANLDPEQVKKLRDVAANLNAKINRKS